MAQSQTIEIKVDVEPARARVKRIQREADALNRDLAQLEDRLEEVERRYADAIKAAYRIDVITERKDAPRE